MLPYQDHRTLIPWSKAVYSEDKDSDSTNKKGYLVQETYSSVTFYSMDLKHLLSCVSLSLSLRHTRMIKITSVQMNVLFNIKKLEQHWYHQAEQAQTKGKEALPCALFILRITSMPLANYTKVYFYFYTPKLIKPVSLKGFSHIWKPFQKK